MRLLREMIRIAEKADRVAIEITRIQRTDIITPGNKAWISKQYNRIQAGARAWRDGVTERGRKVIYPPVAIVYSEPDRKGEGIIGIETGLGGSGQVQLMYRLRGPLPNPEPKSPDIPFVNGVRRPDLAEFQRITKAVVQTDRHEYTLDIYDSAPRRVYKVHRDGKPMYRTSVTWVGDDDDPQKVVWMHRETKRQYPDIQTALEGIIEHIQG